MCTNFLLILQESQNFLACYFKGLCVTQYFYDALYFKTAMRIQTKTVLVSVIIFKLVVLCY